jgi:hypothetical protein
MAHFAKINLENKIIAVLYMNDSDTMENNVENELVGQQYLEKNNNWPAHMWIKTSYNTTNNKHTNGKTPFRGNYAAIGGTWDPVNQIFWPPKPYNSWIQDLTTASWIPPITKPELTEEQKNSNIEHVYEWNEQNQSWDLKIYS